MTVLELAVGGLPFPHGDADGRWRHRHAVRPEGPTALDHQAVADFLAYEGAHGRDVVVVAEPALSGWARWPVPPDRPPPGSAPIQCCTHAYADGCGAELVCHGAPVAIARRILDRGVLRPATAVTGRTAGVLAAESTWGEPADYFDHVMLANGACTAPEAVARSRVLGRDLVPSDLLPGYPPAVRFYFSWADLARRPDARFDGVHSVKILGELSLDDVLVAAVVNAGQAAGLDGVVATRLRERIVVLDVDSPLPEEWASAALTAARERA